LWRSKKKNIFDLAMFERAHIFGTHLKGSITYVIILILVSYRVTISRQRTR